MFAKLRLFPGKCEKSTIRYFFEYCQPDDLGLDYEDFTLFLPILGLHTIQRGKKVADNMKKNTKYDTNIINIGSKKSLNLPDTPLEMVI